MVSKLRITWKQTVRCGDSNQPVSPTVDGEEEPGIKDFILLVNDENFVKNLKTVYRESEDQFPGVDCTRQYRTRRY